HGTDVVYCLKCVNIGRSDSVTPLRVIHTAEKAEVCRYHLGFELSVAQQAASDRIVGALAAHSDMLLHAVTGAGKTDIVFEALSLDRLRGMDVAYGSPRIDGFKAVHLPLRGALSDSTIAQLYTAVKVEFEHTFTVCTVCQLYEYIGHFGLIIVDATDAFPMYS